MPVDTRSKCGFRAATGRYTSVPTIKDNTDNVHCDVPALAPPQILRVTVEIS